MNPKDRVPAILMIGTSVGLVCFWILFFTLGLAPDPAPNCYFAYEHSFPLPDGALSVILLLAGIFLLKSDPRGPRLALVGAGGLLFLGLVDFAFNIQNGVYAVSPVELVMNAFINIWCVGLASVLGWRYLRG